MLSRVAATALVALLVGVLPVRVGAKEGFTQGTFEGRGYWVYVPAARAVDTAQPLVIALHGCWQTPEDFALGTRLNEAAERRGLVVLYPAQGRRDNPYRCWNWFDPAHQSAKRGEAGQVLALARRVQDAQGVKAPRVLVLGFSAGGFMAVNLACLAPDRVAGVGAVAAGPFRCGVGAESAIQCMRGPVRDGPTSAAACLAATGGRPLAARASLWHGTLDRVVSPDNLTALETMFARVLGAASAVTETREGAVVAVHRNARGVPVLETWLVRGMGHAWSGGDARGTYTYPPGPDATSRILDFLLAPERPERPR